MQVLWEGCEDTNVSVMLYKVEELDLVLVAKTGESRLPQNGTRRGELTSFYSLTIFIRVW